MTITNLLEACDGPWDVEAQEIEVDGSWGRVLCQMRTYSECFQYIEEHSGPDWLPMRIVKTPEHLISA